VPFRRSMEFSQEVRGIFEKWECEEGETTSRVG
jgi:hypothetical protein